MRGTKGNQRYFSVLVLPLLAVLLFLAGPKRAEANGTLTATFVYNGSGSNQPLAGAYAYLHAYPQGTLIAEKYFRPAQYILGPSDSNGNFNVSVPDGQYRVMLIQKAQASIPQGPPLNGDYIWRYAGYITVASGSTVDLGTVYARVFAAPATIKGTVIRFGNNTPEVKFFVFATKEPCPYTRQRPQDSGAPEYNCSPLVKYPAVGPTDSNGNYTLQIKDPGTYYVYASPNPGQRGYAHHAAGPKPCGPINYYDNSVAYVNPITVTAGGTFTMNCSWAGESVAP